MFLIPLSGLIPSLQRGGCGVVKIFYRIQLIFMKPGFFVSRYKRWVGEETFYSVELLLLDGEDLLLAERWVDLLSG